MSSAKLSTCSDTTIDKPRSSRIALQGARHVLDDRGLDAFGRLVQQQHLRLGGERARDRELLLLAAGQVAAAAALHFQQHREQLVDVAGHLGLAGDDQAGLDVFLHRHGGEDHAALRHVGEALGDALIALQRGQLGAVHACTEPLLVGTIPISDFISVVLPMPLRPMIGDDFVGRDRDVEAVQHSLWP